MRISLVMCVCFPAESGPTEGKDRSGQYPCSGIRRYFSVSSRSHFAGKHTLAGIV